MLMQDWMNPPRKNWKMSRANLNTIARLGAGRLVDSRMEALDYRPVLNWRGQPASTSASTRPRMDISEIVSRLIPAQPKPQFLRRV